MIRICAGAAKENYGLCRRKAVGEKCDRGAERERENEATRMEKRTVHFVAN